MQSCSPFWWLHFRQPASGRAERVCTHCPYSEEQLPRGFSRCHRTDSQDQSSVFCTFNQLSQWGAKPKGIYVSLKLNQISCEKVNLTLAYDLFQHAMIRVGEVPSWSCLTRRTHYGEMHHLWWGLSRQWLHWELCLTA